MSVMVSVAVSQVGMTELIFVRWTASITAMSCCLSRCIQQSNVSKNVVYSQNNMLHEAKLVIFLCSVISQGKVVTLDRWGGKWNRLSMTHRLFTNYAKNYCNRTLIVKVIVENVVTCFLGHSVVHERTNDRLIDWMKLMTRPALYHTQYAFPRYLYISDQWGPQLCQKAEANMLSLGRIADRILSHSRLSTPCPKKHVTTFSTITLTVSVRFQ